MPLSIIKIDFMATETGYKIGAVITFLGIIFAVAGLFTDSIGFYAFVGVIVLFLGRVVKEYF